MIERFCWTWHPFYNGLTPRGLRHPADDALDRSGVDTVRCGTGPYGLFDQRSRQLMTFRQFGLDALKFSASRPGYQGHCYGQDGMATIEQHPNLPGDLKPLGCKLRTTEGTGAGLPDHEGARPGCL
jgi:hypothetical protein